MKRIKILHITTDSRIGGAERLLCWLARYLDPSRFAMSVCTLKPHGDLHDLLQKMNITVYDLGIEHFTDVFEGRRMLLQILQEEQPDIVHTHLLYAGLLGRWAVQDTNVKLIHTRHYADFFPAWFNPLRYVDGFLMRHSPLVIAISRAVEKVLIEKLGVNRTKIKQINNAVDIEWILDDAKQNPDDAVERMIHQTKSPRIGLVGNFHPCKGHDLLIRAIPDILQIRPDAQFIFIGDGSGRRRIENRVEALGLSKHVYFAGFVRQIAVAMKHLDLLVIPSKSEGFGLVACEAMVLGVPVVANSVDGLVEIIDHQETGLIFENGNTKSLVEAVCRLLGDEVLRRRCTEHAQKKVAEQYDIRLMTRSLEQTYLEVLGEL